MSLSADLNRATAQARRAATNYGHSLSPLLVIEHDRQMVYEASCLAAGCEARVHITSLLEPHGRAMHTHCPYTTEKEEEPVSEVGD